MICALHAQALVQCGTAHLRGIPLYLNDVGSDAFRLLRQLQQVRFVLRFDYCAAVGKVDCRLSEDVVIREFPEALIVGRDRCLISSNCGGVRRSLRLFSLELSLFLLNLLFLGLNLLVALLDLLLVRLDLLLGRS